MPPARTAEEEEEEEEAFGGGDWQDEAELDPSDDEHIGSLVYQPLPKLPTCHYHRRTIDNLVEMMNTRWLNLNPDYQRDVVWGTDRMTRLINSIMTHYYIPPLIFNTQIVRDDEGKETYMRTAIDGKQRLTSIYQFVNGEIPCTDAKGRRWYFKNKEAKKNRLLPVTVRRQFMNHQLICVEFSNLDRIQEEDLFSRVQLGIPLTPAEKLRATTGPWQQFAVGMANAYEEVMKLIDNGRGRAFQMVLSVLRQIVFADDGSVKYSGGAGVLKSFCDRKELLTPDIQKRAYRVFDAFNEVLQRYPEAFANHNYAHSLKFSPIEFVAVGTLINKYPNRNVTMLKGDILHLRRYLREERQDLRSNSKTWETIKEWIDNIENYRGGVNVVPARRSAANEPVPSTGRGEPFAPAPPGREELDDDAMSEYGTPAPPSRELWPRKKRKTEEEDIKEEMAVKRERIGR